MASRGNQQTAVAVPAEGFVREPGVRDRLLSLEPHKRFVKKTEVVCEDCAGKLVLVIFELRRCERAEQPRSRPLRTHL